MVAEPGSVERGDVDEVPVPSPVQNEVSAAEQPLAVAVVQPEESSDPGKLFLKLRWALLITIFNFQLCQ